MLFTHPVASRGVAVPRARAHPEGGLCGRCCARARDRVWLGSGRAADWWSGPHRRAMLAVCNPSIVQWIVCFTTCMDQDAWQIYPCVCDEIRTYMCGSGSSVAAVAIAVDREASDASRGLKRPEKQRPTHICRMSITGLRMLKSVL